MGVKIISKTLMTKISHISWGGYDKGFYGTENLNEFSKYIFDFEGYLFFSNKQNINFAWILSQKLFALEVFSI